MPRLRNPRPERICVLVSGGVESAALLAHFLRRGHGVLPLYMRAGYAWERLLVFGKLGAAFTNDKLSVTCNAGPQNTVLLQPVGQQCANPAGVFSNGFSGSTGRSGVLAGLGWEFALANNWSIKAEYDYLPYGRKTVSASDGSLISARRESNEVKLGLNYNFASK